MWSEIYNFFAGILGLSYENGQLTAYHLIARASLVYLCGIILFRSQREFMSINTPFTFVLNFIMGSALASAITGEAPYFATLAMFIFITFMNWIISIIAYYSEFFEKLIKGKPELLIKNGKIQWGVMRRNLITRDELMDAVRDHTQSDNLSKVKKAYFENSGKITIIKS